MSNIISRKPNIVFILTDQQRADTLGVSGNSFAQTPNIDILAEGATRYENAYCTQPICTPSRSSLLTGLYPHATGCSENNLHLDKDVPTLPEMLPTGEWKTAYFGKWHLGDEVFAQRGFQNWISTEDQYWKHYSQKRNIDTYSTYHDWLTNNQGIYPDSGDRFSRTETANLPKEFTKIDYLAEQAERFIQESSEEPFILYIGFLEPHPPYTGPFNDFRSEIQVPLPANFNDLCGSERHPKNRLQADYYRYFGGEAAEDFDLNTTKGWKDLIRRYHGMCHHVDLGVGRIIEALHIIKTFRISIVNSSRGTVQATPIKDTYYEGDVVTLEAVPYTNYLFNKWSINGEDINDNPISFVLSKNLVVYPQFSIIPEYSLDVKYNKNIGGVTSPISETPGLYYGGIYQQNTTIQLRVTAINESGYSFSHWEVNGTEFYENPINIYLNSDTIVRPKFIDTKEVIDPDNFITVTDSLSGSYVGSGYCYRSLIYKLVNASDFSITVLGVCRT